MKTFQCLIKIFLPGCFLFLFPTRCLPQDTMISVSKKIVTLTEVVVRNNLNVPNFIERVQKDTTFYKAFKNLRILGFTSLNDIRMLDKKGNIKATLQSKTQQSVSKGCRTTQILQEKASGDIYNKNGSWNYYTAAMYASLFFSNGTICGENNIVSGELTGTSGKSGMEKHKEQLKMLIFNPGKRIRGIPFISNKVAIFDDEQASLYDFVIDMGDYLGQNCYIFIIKAKENLGSSEKDQVVINNMTTWFNSQTMEIVARDYDLSYDAGVYDFDVHMEVRMNKFGGLLVPALIRYTGNWHAILKKREKGFFTSTLFDFKH